MSLVPEQREGVVGGRMGGVHPGVIARVAFAAVTDQGMDVARRESHDSMR